MRITEDESAAVVLERLRASRPQPPSYVNPHNKRPHQDHTFGDRLQAWQAAVTREELRLKAEQEGKLPEHLERLQAIANRDRKLRLAEEKKQRAELRALRAAKKKKKKTKR